VIDSRTVHACVVSPLPLGPYNPVEHGEPLHAKAAEIKRRREERARVTDLLESRVTETTRCEGRASCNLKGSAKET
jgi:hypothetical protein